MLILSLDSSQSNCSVSLLKDDKVIETSLNSTPREQSQLLVPMIQSMLENYDSELKDVDLFTVTTGPGSFTGIRIGLATMRGFSIALDKPLMGIPTFDVYFDAYSEKNRELLVVLESLRKELFFQYYNSDGSYKYPAVNSLTEDLQFDVASDVIIAGNAVNKFDNSLEEVQVNLSECLGIMAYKKYIKGDCNIEGYPAIPYYMRDPDVTTSNKKIRQIK